MGGPASHRISRVRRYSRSPITRRGPQHPTGLSPSPVARSSGVRCQHSARRAPCHALHRSRSTPHQQRRQPRTLIGFRLLPVRSPLLRESSLFLGVREMFQFPRCPPRMRGVRYDHGRVAPFGDLGITGSQRLPQAFRRVSASFIGPKRLGIHHVPIFESCPGIIPGLVLLRGARGDACRLAVASVRDLPGRAIHISLSRCSRDGSVEPRGFEPRTSAVQGRRSPG